MPTDTPQLHVEVTRGLDAADLARVGEIIATATRVDDAVPLSEQARLRVRYGGGPAADAGWSLLGRLEHQGERLLVGYAQVYPDGEGRDGDAAPAHGVVGELVVDPAWRGRGYGRTMVGTLVVTADAAAPGAPVRLWAHGGHPAAARLAASCDFAPVRELWLMARRVDASLPAVELPAGVTLRAFRPGVDDAAWLALNARAFAHHPEQGDWSAADLALRLREDWFAPEDFLLAERDGQLVGFHWTKIDPRAARPGVTVGEIYVLGIDPDAQGGGLGHALAVAGLQHLRDRGAAEVILYVEGDNTAAVRLYQRLGFARRSLDVMYRRV